jgi:osmotically-inducible protein OsmY
MQTTKVDFQEDIIEALAFDPRITTDDIAVSVKEGVVTLYGTVPSLSEKWEAEEVVKRIRGVRGIADELIVDLPATHARSDTDIALAIARRFESNVIIPSDVRFVVKDGYVTLSGEVTWYYQSQEAAYEARRVVGVRDVANVITVKSSASPSAEEIKQKIHNALARTADAEADRIDVTVFGGVVKLSGTARTWLESDNAAQAAWSILGVTHVDNFIEVNPW